ncbi:hypothetical protein B0T21DRAFT_277811 [Apiosordaria backusii]|uniref:TMEM205-like domain-containing protein n=1 Tax=Apiosordaria backusii TaxID=314023 RepID=A0AA40K7D3_9PEZI|nr:hypothetical protein B0T21DRAFT_277811 [Apiosordaria backusii]
MGFFSPAPYHILSYGVLLGTTFFHTFIGGIVSFRVLPRPQFSSLMSSLFPVYFTIQTALPLVLAITYPGSQNPFGITSGISGFLHSSNRYSTFVPITAAFASALANLAFVGPLTTKVMDERKLQERKDGKKSWDAPPHSQEMQALNKQFSILHGVSSLLNLGTFVGSVVYGVTLSKRIS